MRVHVRFQKNCDGIEFGACSVYGTDDETAQNVIRGVYTFIRDTKPRETAVAGTELTDYLRKMGAHAVIFYGD